MDRVGGKTAQASAEMQNSSGERLMTASATLIRSLDGDIPAPFAVCSRMPAVSACHPTSFGMLWDLSQENYGAAFELRSALPSPTLGFGPNKVQTNMLLFCQFVREVSTIEYRCGSSRRWRWWRGSARRRSAARCAPPTRATASAPPWTTATGRGLPLSRSVFL
jgi:hypothetical protein